jgi:2-keto-4-pentenoate hydratase/2-oxohepta-3-ene-1,7-dioic acid hydratase in catechol pathway
MFLVLVAVAWTLSVHVDRRRVAFVGGAAILPVAASTLVFPGTGAFGPWMMTTYEFSFRGSQRLQTRVNGQVVQEATFDQMIFDVPRMIEYCSTFTRLEPGDVIATGTPGGVGAKRTPPLWLKPGDTVEVEIDDLGILRNGVADEA